MLLRQKVLQVLCTAWLGGVALDYWFRRCKADLPSLLGLGSTIAGIVLLSRWS